MPRANNITLIKSFLSSSENHLIINQVNDEIGLFYVYLIQILALDQKLSVYISEEINAKNSNDLFGEIKIPIIKTASTSKLKDILSSNQRNIIITDYKNYKKFNNQLTSINGYDYAKDIKSFIKDYLQIENDNLLSNCIESPVLVYSETSKFLTNKFGYYSEQFLQKENNFILEIRKAIFDIKSKNKNMKNLYDKIKEEFKYKKFNFLTY